MGCTGYPPCDQPGHVERRAPAAPRQRRPKGRDGAGRAIHQVAKRIRDRVDPGRQLHGGDRRRPRGARAARPEGRDQGPCRRGHRIVHQRGGEGIGLPLQRPPDANLHHDRRRLHRRPAPQVMGCRVELAVEEAAKRRERGRHGGVRGDTGGAGVRPRAGHGRDLPAVPQNRRLTIREPPLQHPHDSRRALRIAVEAADEHQPLARGVGPDGLDRPEPAARGRDARGIHLHRRRVERSAGPGAPAPHRRSVRPAAPGLESTPPARARRPAAAP